MLSGRVNQEVNCRLDLIVGKQHVPAAGRYPVFPAKGLIGGLIGSVGSDSGLHQIPIPINVVYPPCSEPVFGCVNRRDWESCYLTLIRAIPFSSRYVGRCGHSKECRFDVSRMVQDTNHGNAFVVNQVKQNICCGSWPTPHAACQFRARGPHQWLGCKQISFAFDALKHLISSI